MSFVISEGYIRGRVSGRDVVAPVPKGSAGLTLYRRLSVLCHRHGLYEAVDRGRQHSGRALMAVLFDAESWPLIDDTVRMFTVGGVQVTDATIDTLFAGRHDEPAAIAQETWSVLGFFLPPGVTRAMAEKAQAEAEEAAQPPAPPAQDPAGAV